ncbi:MAG: hypothetical protein JSU90_06465 [Nitrospiraceae bacterium]|nr:MAG: hypothetical protein JSU90_06465 [Nitrospiraceae bacterium]
MECVISTNKGFFTGPVRNSPVLFAQTGICEFYFLEGIIESRKGHDERAVFQDPLVTEEEAERRKAMSGSMLFLRFAFWKAAVAELPQMGMQFSTVYPVVIINSGSL